VTDGGFDLIMRGFERWNRGDIDATLDLIHPDVEWVTGGIIPDADPVYRGHAGVRRFFADFMGAFEAISIEPLDHREAGDEVVMKVRFQARGREGVTADLEVGQHYILHDGKLARFEAYASWEEALAAAGLT
jgi:ketosteroid isomerase-like protein